MLLKANVEQIQKHVGELARMNPVDHLHQQTETYRHLAGKPDALKGCVVARSVESLLQTGGVQRKTSGSSDPPEGESRRGQQHVREAEDIGRRL